MPGRLFSNMSFTRSALVLAGLTSCLLPGLASAQTTVQGQIIIQEAAPTTSAAPPPQAQAYGQPVYQQPAQVYVQPQQTTPQCPVGAQLQVDQYGRQGCVMETTRHHVSGGLLGGGIGLLAGGWVISGVSGLFAALFGSVGCAFGGSGSCFDASAFMGWGWIPVIGPWGQMGYVWPNADTGMYAWLAIEGALQAAGLVMLIFGAVGEDSVELTPVPGYAIRIQPMLSATTQGLSAEMRF